MPSILQSTPATWADMAVSTIAERLSLCLATHDQASLVVPGGRSAAAILPLLAERNLPWHRITVTLTDERWVSSDHADSNARLVREHLLAATQARFVGLKTDDASPQDALATVGGNLRHIARPFDVVFLGMGDDGHIASLFPGDAIESGELQSAQRPDHPRISMTPTCLLNSRHIILPISGEKKREVFDLAMRPGPESELPVRHILHQDAVPVTVIVD